MERFITYIRLFIRWIGEYYIPNLLKTSFHENAFNHLKDDFSLVDVYSSKDPKQIRKLANPL